MTLAQRSAFKGFATARGANFFVRMVRSNKASHLSMVLPPRAQPTKGGSMLIVGGAKRSIAPRRGLPSGGFPER